MKKEELRKSLQEKSVPEYYYNIDTIGEIDQRVCLEFDDGKWIVYYSERGKKFDLVKYQIEEEACDDIFTRLLNQR